MGKVNFLVKKIAGFFGIGEDILAYYPALRNVAQPSEVAIPKELLPLGARLILKGMLNSQAIAPNPDWIWAYWIEKQYDPKSPSFMGRGHLLTSNNCTHRNWTGIGCLESKNEAIVDERGLVTPWYDGWSLDVFLLFPNRLVAPSKIKEVKQRLKESLPIIQTQLEEEEIEVSIEVLASKLEGDDLIWEEVRLKNKSSLDKNFSLVFSLRPYNPEGISIIGSLEYKEGSFLVNDKLGIVFSAPPDFVDTSSYREGDVSTKLSLSSSLPGCDRAQTGLPVRDRTQTGDRAQQTDSTSHPSVKCKVGMATGLVEYRLNLKPEEEKKFLVALPLRGKMPADGVHSPRSTVHGPRSTVHGPQSTVHGPQSTAHGPQSTAHSGQKPSKEVFSLQLIDKIKNKNFSSVKKEVIQDWQEELRDIIKIKLPDKLMQDCFEVNQAYLLLLYDGDEICPGPFTYHAGWLRDGAYMVSALDKMGLKEEAKEILLTYPQKQKRNGLFVGPSGEWDSNGQAIWTLVEHYRYTQDKEFLEEVYPSIKRGVLWIEKKRHQSKDKKALHYGLLPPNLSAEHLGPNDYFYWDDFWALGGIRAAVYAALVLGKEKDKLRFQGIYSSFWQDIEESLRKVEKRLNTKAIPASPYRRLDAGMIGSVCSLYPLWIFSPDNERIRQTLTELRKRCFVEDAFYQSLIHSGLNCYLTMQIAECYLYQRSEEALPLMSWVLKNATSTFTWPEAINPLTRGGVIGDGHHGWAVADWLHLIRNLLFFEEGDTLVLTPSLPLDWLGEGKEIAVRQAPSHFGLIEWTLFLEKERVKLNLNCSFRKPPQSIEFNLPKKIVKAVVEGKEVSFKENKVILTPGVREVEVFFMADG